MDQNELPLGSRNLGVPLGASKTISEHTARLLQTLHLSCTDTNTITILVSRLALSPNLLKQAST
jgi:hypothetical protein